MIKKFKSFSELMLSYASLYTEVMERLDDASPQIFEKFLDTFFINFDNSLKLYYAGNNYRHAVKEEKFITKTMIKDWKKKLKLKFERKQKTDDKKS